MTETTTKIFTVTGDAAAAMGGTRRRRKSTAARNATMRVGKEQSGGDSSGANIQIQANRAPGGAEPPPMKYANSTDVALAKTTTESSPAPAAVKPQVAGAKPVKVILEKKKKTTHVVLAPTKVKKLHPLTAPGKTRKVAKKIRMSLNGFGKRVTRANTIRNDAKKQTIVDIKRTLVEAKLVKGDSKAPEAVLRQIYADYMMLKNRAL